MKKQISLCVVSLLILMTSTTRSDCQDRGGNEGIKDRFIGAWRLVSLEAPSGDGTIIHRSDSSGLLVFTSDGHMSVQVMERNPPAQAHAGPEQYSQGGYEASFGRYEIDDAHAFTFHVEGALVRTLIGKDLNRIYELSGKQLIVKSSDPNEHWRVAWEHY